MKVGQIYSFVYQNKKMFFLLLKLPPDNNNEVKLFTFLGDDGIVSRFGGKSIMYHLSKPITT